MRTGHYIYNSISSGAVAVIALLGTAACTAETKGSAQQTADDGDEGDGVPESSGTTPAGSSEGAAEAGETAPVTTADATDESSSGKDSGFYFDVGGSTDLPFDPDACGAPPLVACDNGNNDDPWNAIELNCPGGTQVDGLQQGDPLAYHIHDGDLGTFVPAPFPPRAGNKFLVMSSGHAADITTPGATSSNNNDGFVDDGADLPFPMLSNRVDALETCTDDVGLVGTGDCSNTIQDQWEQGNGAFDWVEMRFEATVPANTTGFSYDLAFFSYEYPVYYQSQFNDMYIAWLESENWTGNISFDEAGAPISLNAGFLDYKDAPNMYDCPAPCNAPELAGTSMVGHAGTKWLTTTAGVTPNEDITVIFALFDMSDPSLDSFVLIDNFHWGCQGGPPVTIPG